MYEMSNAELRKLNERQNLEFQYKRQNPGNITRTIAIVGTTAAVLGNLSGIQKNSSNLIRGGKKVVKSAIKKFK